ncbi:MAG: hypothetical protein WC248_07030 [Candidatus Methanomethylophilaceae archaeon]|jgi:hypothetical protein
MELKFINKTDQPQQIMFVDGSCKTVIPEAEEIVGIDSIFSEEIFRLKGFFNIEPIEEKIVVQEKAYEVPVESYKRKARETQEIKEDGGDE